MKLHIEHNDTIIDYEHHPMPEGRFRALCSLDFYAIGGTLLLGAIALVGVWDIAEAAGCWWR